MEYQSSVTERIIIRRMIGLTDSQLQILMTAAGRLDPDRRSVFFERCGAMLRMRHRFNDADVTDLAKLALTGLAQQPAA
jgi:hypothetical protein